jgi:hypothetical protein
VGAAVIFLPLIGYTPAMHGTQPIAVVWVDTSRDRWGDTSGASAVLNEALRWWERQVDVSFVVTEGAMTIDADPYTFDICHERSWAPQGRAIYMLAWEPTGRVFTCDGVNVADWATPEGALVWGGIRAAEMAHTIGHFYGAQDTHAGTPDGPTHDIMDRDAVYTAYHTGYVAARTLAAIGATRRAGASELSLRVRRGYRAGARREAVSYPYKRWQGQV